MRSVFVRIVDSFERAALASNHLCMQSPWASWPRASQPLPVFDLLASAHEVTSGSTVVMLWGIPTDYVKSSRTHP